MKPCLLGEDRLEHRPHPLECACDGQWLVYMPAVQRWVSIWEQVSS